MRAKRILLLVIVILVVLQAVPVVQKAEARLTSSIYLDFKYSDRQLEYQNTEYDSHFGEYLVSYQDDSGKNLSFMIKPKYFPFFLSYDPLDTSR